MTHKELLEIKKELRKLADIAWDKGDRPLSSRIHELASSINA